MTSYILMRSCYLALTSCAVIAGYLMAGPVAFAAEALRAGAAAIEITPSTFPVRIAGSMLEKTATQAMDRLHVRCLVLDDGRSKIAFAVVDTCVMPQALIDAAKQQASERCGIPVARMMVSATHTHSAPAAMSCLGTRADPHYTAWLPGKIAEGIVAANANLQPARIGWASVDDWEHTHNRSWIRRPETRLPDPFGNRTVLANMHPGYLSPDIIGPSGPVDPGLSVLSVQTLDRRPLAVLANYSQHYFGAPPASADYYGQFCAHVARMLGQPGEGNGPFVCAMSQGTSGDLMWMDYGSAKKDITMDAYAEGVAQYAVRALERVQYRDWAALGMVEEKLQLNYRVPDEGRLAWARPIAARIIDDLPKNRTEIYAMEAMILHQRQKTEVILQAIRVGDLTIATFPTEVYALTGLKLKAQSPALAHFNIELANGAEGYIPPPEQHVLGGYTTWPARTAGLEVQAEPKMVATLLRALEAVTGEKRRDIPDQHGPYAETVLRTKPVAYWRLNDTSGDLAQNAVPGAAAARVRDGKAWYLPGVGSGSGIGSAEALTTSAFSGGGQINRAVHLAGGDIEAEVGALTNYYTLALWFWLGEASGASERSGTLAIGPGGESLVSRQFRDHRVQLRLADSTSQVELRADEWHFVALVRDGDEVRVYVDGAEKAEIARPLPAASNGTSVKFGPELQGKLDEICVFRRALTPAEIAALWKVSGVGRKLGSNAASTNGRRGGS